MVNRPLLLAAGRDADVFALEDGRVLRRYRDGADATVEAEVMRYVARHGYPVPEVFDVTGPDLVMERVDGPTMADAVQAGGLDVDGAGTMLANLHDRLHDIPGRSQRTGRLWPGRAAASQVANSICPAPADAPLTVR